MATINFGGETATTDTTDRTVMQSTTASKVDDLSEFYYTETITITPERVMIAVKGIRGDAVPIDSLFSDDPAVVAFMARLIAARIESAI